MIETNPELDQLLKANQTRVLPYHNIYAERHNLTAIKVATSEPLNLAAFLEFQVGKGDLSLHEARYRFVEQYPRANCLYIYKESVCRLILPYDQTERTVPSRKPSLVARGKFKTVWNFDTGELEDVYCEIKYTNGTTTR